MSTIPPSGNTVTTPLQPVTLQQQQQPGATAPGIPILSAHSLTPSSTNCTLAGVAKTTLGGGPPTATGQDIQTQLASVATSIHLTPEKFLQLYSQQLTQSTGGRTTSTGPSLILQPGATLKVVTTAPPSSTATTISTGQFASGYQGDAGTVVTQPQLMGMHQQHPSNIYYEHQSLSQHGMHMGLQQGGGDLTPPLTHSTRAHPQTIQWLLDNYETAEGVSLPRSTLYNHYLRHCAANKIDAVNAASFGKLIRSVFIGLKTRRLGTRGNSKYHYYGIRIKPESVLSTYPQEESPTVPMRQLPQSSQAEYPSSEATPEGVEAAPPPEPTPQQLHQQYLGESRPELPPFPEVEWAGTPIPGAVTSEDLSDFTALYREHCEAILDVVVNLQFQMVENLWHHFWNDNSKNDPQGQDDEGGQELSRDQLLLLTSCQPILDYLSTCDHILYQCIADFLIPEVLRPIPGTLTQAIRNFAKSLETWLSNSLQGYSSTMTKSKVCSVVAFSQTLRRYTSLNHLAQAARAVLQNSSQISQMLTDLNRVDFVNVHEQASWVCECDENLVVRLEQDFKSTLQQQKTLEEWATWLEEVVNTVLEPYENGAQFSKAARQFLLKWSFYSSMVIRDLTLRSAASFGSFHLIRLLYDEYMFFLIEHKVARAAGKTPIAVMTEFSGHSRSVFGESESNVLSLEEQVDQENDEDQEPQAKRPKY